MRWNQVANHRAQIHIQNGRVITWSASFNASFKAINSPFSTTNISKNEIIDALEKEFGLGYHRHHPIRNVLVETRNGDLSNAWVIQLKSDDEWLEVYASPEKGIYNQ